MVGADGMTFSVGDASVRIVTTPGHTAGTLSFLFEVKDNGKPLRVAYVGGTAIPFDGTAAYYDAYIASVKKMAKAADDFAATALMSNHTEFDNCLLQGPHGRQSEARRRQPVRCRQGCRRPLLRDGRRLHDCRQAESGRQIVGISSGQRTGEIFFYPCGSRRKGRAIG